MGYSGPNLAWDFLKENLETHLNKFEGEILGQKKFGGLNFQVHHMKCVK